MLLRELKEAVLFREYSEDGHNFATAVSKLKSDSITSGHGVEVDDTGRPPAADVDALLQPIIEMAVETIDPSESLLRSKVEQSLNTPELKNKGAAGIGTAIQMVRYLRTQFIQDFTDLPVSSRVVKLGGAATVQSFVEELDSQRFTSETTEGIKKQILKKKATLVNAVMKRGAADKFHQVSMEAIEAEGKKVELAQSKSLNGLLAGVTQYVGFLKAIESNLTTVKKMIQPDRDVDKEDASA